MPSAIAPWLNLERVSEIGWSFELTERLSRHDRRLYGGTGLAVAVAAMEAQTNRSPLWATVQFAGSAEVGERIDCQVETLASGRRATQVRFTARIGGRVVLAGLGTTGVHDQSLVLDEQIPEMPNVPGPQAGVNWGLAGDIRPQTESWTDIAELLRVEVETDQTLIWARLRGEEPNDRAALAFMADLVPTSVMRAAGYEGAGTSLDNSIRFGRIVPTDWVLYEFEPWFVAGGYLHGGARVWSQDGQLVAYASQTASALVWPRD